MKKYGIILTLMLLLFTFTNIDKEISIEENPKVTSPYNYLEKL